MTAELLKLPKLFKLLDDKDLYESSGTFSTRIVRKNCQMGELFLVLSIKERFWEGKHPSLTGNGPWDIQGIDQQGLHGWLSYGGSFRGLMVSVLGEIEEQQP